MRKIQMVDTKNQYLAIKKEVDGAIQEVLDSAAYINGKAVKDFAQNLSTYLGVGHVIPCANGTDALQIAMMALDLQPGDEIITPSFTYIATTEVVALLGLKPVFIDVDPISFCMDIESLKKAITPKTKVIVPVHLYGHAAPMEEIMEIAKANNLLVIEDNAQAIGCDYTFSNGVTKKTGTIGHIGATSFYPSKNLGAFGDGGALCTNDKALSDKMTMIANHGQSARYYHDVVGCNSRLDSIQAAILNIKLKKLDSYNAARQSVAKYYSDSFASFKEIITPSSLQYSSHVYHQYTIQLIGVNRDRFIEHLASKEIPCMIYYPVPGHLQKMFIEQKNINWNLPITDKLTSCVCSLPVHTEMDEEQLAYIVKGVKSFFK
ncbi:MAG: DegT/DnrJ/EryC1/StrS family aminotransferase [Chitinophagia bacterium]|jgi:dTDP-4-amino-4,6-dideoxygalactose transaminase|nr:DegT/DnrJ/EryC1/StrS family aminotransferase [Chitinophagia bacterium]NCA30899.1 DegT/DnrJ/EryC1/StrS family aminotransferase [Chitinophagia bacterium]